MARTKISNGETITTQVDLASGDRLIVEAGGAIARSGAVPAVRVLGPEAFILNQGTISVTSAGAAVTGALSGDISVRIVNEGDITGTSGAVVFSSPTGTTGAFTLINSGTIAGGASQALALRDLRASTITIVNEVGGLLTNVGSADVVRPGHDLATIIRVVNAGTIMAGDVAGVSDGGDGVDFQAQDGGVAATVINRSTGHIEGGKHGITGANTAFIRNEVDGEIIGRNGSGLNYDTDAADGDGAVRVLNYGLISGRYDGLGDGDGDGVDVDYLVTILNDGRIEGVDADNVENFADGVAAGGGRIVNLAGGDIFGGTNGILIDDGDRNGAYAETKIFNSGFIEGELGAGIRLIGDFDDVLFNRGRVSGATVAVDMGAGDDTVRNTNAIFGDVLLGAGADDYRGDGTVEGAIFGGDGDDTIAGGIGDDVIVGGLGRDVMSGRGGADTYVFTSLDDTPYTTSPLDADTIVFGRGDVIDLSAIDADPDTDGDQAFNLVFALSEDSSGQVGDAVVIGVGDDTYAVGLFTQAGDQPQAAFIVQVADPALLSFVL